MSEKRFYPNGQPRDPYLDEPFVYDPDSRTLKRFENNVNTERMNLQNVSPTAGSLFDQNLGLVQGHWQMPVRDQLLTFSAYGTPARMR